MIISVLGKVPNENRAIRETSNLHCDFENGFDFQLGACSFEALKDVI